MKRMVQMSAIIIAVVLFVVCSGCISNAERKAQKDFRDNREQLRGEVVQAARTAKSDMAQRGFDLAKAHMSKDDRAAFAEEISNAINNSRFVGAQDSLYSVSLELGYFARSHGVPEDHVKNYLDKVVTARTLGDYATKAAEAKDQTTLDQVEKTFNERRREFEDLFAEKYPDAQSDRSGVVNGNRL